MDAAHEHEVDQQRYGDVALALEALQEPLERIVADVFRLYQARTPEELLALSRSRYSKDATFVDPTVVAPPRSELEMQFFALQRLSSRVSVSGIAPPEVEVAPQGRPLLQITVHSCQELHFARRTHIAAQILPEVSQFQTTTRLLLDPRTGLILRHEDTWDNKRRLHLPLAMRRLNSVCTNAVYRFLGWGRELAAAEQRCAAAPAGPPGASAAHDGISGSRAADSRVGGSS